MWHNYELNQHIRRDIKLIYLCDINWILGFMEKIEK
jgi:hypothetical protein